MPCSASSPGTSSPQLTLTGGVRALPVTTTRCAASSASPPATAAGPASPPASARPRCRNRPAPTSTRTTSDTDFIHRLNLTYRITDDHLVYATWSRGFRPGGINRRGTLPPYGADFISNYELGFKTSWADNRLRFNVALYQLDWDNIQLSFLGANGLTEIRNAGNARIRGIEFDLFARPTPGLTLSLGGAYNDAEITEDFCLIANAEFDCTLGVDLDGDGIPEPNALLAPSGTRLPITARFKGNARIRYEFDAGNEWEGHVQLTASHEGSRTRDLRLLQRAIYGNLRATNIVDFSTGLRRGDWNAELFVRNVFDARGALGSAHPVQRDRSAATRSASPRSGPKSTPSSTPRARSGSGSAGGSSRRASIRHFAKLSAYSA